MEGSKAEFMAFIPPGTRYAASQLKGVLRRKRAAIEALEARGVSVCFQGSKFEATASVRDSVKQYAIKNYQGWLNL